MVYNRDQVSQLLLSQPATSWKQEPVLWRLDRKRIDVPSATLRTEMDILADEKRGLQFVRKFAVIHLFCGSFDVLTVMRTFFISPYDLDVHIFLYVYPIKRPLILNIFFI